MMLTFFILFDLNYIIEGEKYSTKVGAFIPGNITHKELYYSHILIYYLPYVTYSLKVGRGEASNLLKLAD
jgi:hypothetical protein